MMRDGGLLDGQRSLQISDADRSLGTSQKSQDLEANRVGEDVQVVAELSRRSVI